jgi:site-specific DNA-methyltransferase (adenine-specific)
MKQLNDDKQMKDVWKLPAIAPWEKSCGKHPTQKPLSVLTRLILASTKPNAWILDPFAVYNFCISYQKNLSSFHYT